MVTLTYIALNIWHVDPEIVYDMKETMLYDVIRRQNLQSAVDDSEETFLNPAKPQDYDEDIPDQATRFSL